MKSIYVGGWKRSFEVLDGHRIVDGDELQSVINGLQNKTLHMDFDTGCLVEPKPIRFIVIWGYKFLTTKYRFREIEN